MGPAVGQFQRLAARPLGRAKSGIAAIGIHCPTGEWDIHRKGT